MIDFHCHLDLYPEPERIARECSERRMYVLSVTNTPAAWEGTNALASGLDRIRTAIGLHPQLAGQRRGELARFRELLPETRYVGEVGLDGTPECLPFWRDQVEVFESVLRTCVSVGGRVLSVHSRRAEDDVLSRIEHYPGAGRFVLHWFSGRHRDLQRAIELGCWFSVGHSMLRTKSGCNLVAMMPRDRVLTESDGPFATYQGRPAMPWDVEEAVHELAKIWQLSTSEVEARLTLNLRALVGEGPFHQSNGYTL
jgi:TatD DNase family protein